MKKLKYFLLAILFYNSEVELYSQNELIIPIDVVKCRNMKQGKCDCLEKVWLNDLSEPNTIAHAYYYSVFESCFELSAERLRSMNAAIKTWESFPYTGHRKHFAYKYIMEHYLHNEFDLDSLKHYLQKAKNSTTNESLNAKLNLAECYNVLGKGYGKIGDYYTQHNHYDSFIKSHLFQSSHDSIKIMNLYYAAEGLLDTPTKQNIKLSKEYLNSAMSKLQNNSFRSESNNKLYQGLISYNFGRALERENNYHEALNSFLKERNTFRQLELIKYDAISSSSISEMAFYLNKYNLSINEANYAIELFRRELHNDNFRCIPYLWLAKSLSSQKGYNNKEVEHIIFEGINISFNTDTIHYENISTLDILKSSNLDYSLKLILELASINFRNWKTTRNIESLKLAKEIYEYTFIQFHNYIAKQNNLNSRYLNKEIQIELFERLVEIGSILESNKSLFEIIDNNKMSILNDANEYHNFSLDVSFTDYTIIQYSFTSDSLIAVVYDDPDFRKYNLTTKEEISLLIAKFTKEINGKSDDIYETSLLLYNSLVKPLDLKDKKLIIIPDNELYYLPFGALRNDPNNMFSFLENNYVINYQYSIHSLVKRLKDKKSLFKNIALFIPEFKDDPSLSYANTRSAGISRELFHLPYAYSEGEFIKNEFDGRFTNVSKDSLIYSLEHDAIVHFAGHAINVPDNPDYSFLALDSDVKNQENILRLKELLHLDCNSDMVVLSACETGTGKIAKGEGSLSLARGFFQAGAKSVISTLWSVNDRSSSIVIEKFYDNLKKGFRKDEALRNAKTSYLANMKDPQYQHPYYWSGFIATGDMSPIETSSWDRYLILGILLFCTLLFGIYLIWKS